MNLHKPCTIPVHIVIYRNAYYIEMNITINALHFIVRVFKIILAMFWKHWRMPEFFSFQLHLKFNMEIVHIINTKNKFSMTANYGIYYV